MSTTYLDVVNDLLAETNEVELSSGTFSSAVGIHSYVKRVVNRAYLDICSYKKTWPFLSAAQSNANDPFAGNVFIPTVEGQRWYLLKPGSTSVNTDYAHVDLNSFFLTTEGVVGETAPPVYRALKFISFDNWFKSRSASEGSEEVLAQPERIIISKDGRYFGLSPVPDKEYRIYFNAWERPNKLVNFNDPILIPDTYLPVLLDKARSYIHQFKQDDMAVSVALADYNRGLRKMSLDLIGESIKDFSDDRIR